MKPQVKEKFPFKVAVKLVRGKSNATQDEVDEFVIVARDLYEKSQKQYSEIMDLKRQLLIAKQEIKFLQVT